MKRTQLYLDEALAKRLAALSRQRGTTISELVRESIREKYEAGRDLDRAAIARKLTGIWAQRKDLARVGAAVRRLRKGKRIKALKNG